MKTVVALAALAAIGFTGTAFAEDATKGWTATTGPAPMSDTDMGKVTAGATPDNPGFGIETAGQASLNAHSDNAGPKSPPSGKGLGQDTVPGAASPVH